MAFLFTPMVGFHFTVVFELFPQQPDDICFQEVSGLSVDLEMEAVKEGGQNRFTWQLPVRTKYEDITLKRGLIPLSGISLWCKDALENFDFKPCNILISLMNESHLPLKNWYVINAIPKKWSVSNLNSTENAIAVESLVLSYQYFMVI